MLFGLFTTAGEKRKAAEREERIRIRLIRMAKQTLQDAGICPKHRCDMETDHHKVPAIYVCAQCKEEQTQRAAREATEQDAARARKIAEAKKTLGWDADSIEVTSPQTT